MSILVGIEVIIAIDILVSRQIDFSIKAGVIGVRKLMPNLSRGGCETKAMRHCQ